MSVIVIFQNKPTPLSLLEISETLEGLLGLPVTLAKDGKPVKLEDYPGRDQPLKEGALWVALPELEEDEGDPILDYAAIPRGDRDDAIKELVAQMVEQDPSLAPIVTKNALDIIITFEGSAASVEAGCAVAYAVAAAAESGVLLLDGPDEGEFEEDGEDDEEQEGAEDEGGETVWFPDAESFADFVFNEDDEEE